MGGPRYGLPIFWCHRRVGSMASYQEFAVVDWASRLDACSPAGVSSISRPTKSDTRRC